MEDIADKPEGSERPTAEWWYRRSGLVYFFGAGQPLVAIKIGVTTIPKEKDELQEGDWLACIRQRHKQIQSSNHETIVLLGIIRFFDGERPARLAENREQELHKQFATLQRFKPHTCGAEWFKPGAQLLDYIQNNAETLKDYPCAVGLPINR